MSQSTRTGGEPVGLPKVQTSLASICDSPDILVSMAAEQWESADQRVERFKALGFTSWTMRHAFFADMGGMLLHTLDIPPFPLNSEELAYLVEKNTCHIQLSTK